MSVVIKIITSVSTYPQALLLSFSHINDNMLLL